MAITFTAQCPHCHSDARWTQPRTEGIRLTVDPIEFTIICPSCTGVALPAEQPPAAPDVQPVPLAPLLLRRLGYPGRLVFW